MQTNFAELTTEQKTVWSRDLWRVARRNAFISQFLGSGPNAMIQRITELTQSEKGARAVITLISDIEGDGVAGDNTLEGREEEIKAFDRVIRVDQLRNANRTTGRMADQRSIINFRENSRDQLGYWMADRLDQLAFQALAGVGYAYNTKGIARADSTFASLDYAADVTAASTLRHRNWTTTGLAAGAITDSTIDYPSWEMMVELRAYAKNHYIRGVRGDGGTELFHIFLSPSAMAKLKMDPDYLAAARNALPRSKSNQLWTGHTGLEIDGLMIHEYRSVPVFDTVTNAVDFNGEGIPAVNGCTMLFCGAQALAMADLGNPGWTEKYFDFDNQHGIAIDKICGFLKPKFYSHHDSADEDFGVVRVNIKA